MDQTLINLTFYLSQFAAMVLFFWNPVLPFRKNMVRYLTIVLTILIFGYGVITYNPNTEQVIFAPVYLILIYTFFMEVSILVFIRNFDPSQAVALAYLVTFFMNFLWQVPVYVDSILHFGVQEAVIFHLIIAYSGVFLFTHLRPVNKKYFIVVLVSWALATSTILLYPNPNDYTWRWMDSGAYLFIVVRIISYAGLILMVKNAIPKSSSTLQRRT